MSTSREMSRGGARSVRHDMRWTHCLTRGAPRGYFRTGNLTAIKEARGIDRRRTCAGPDPAAPTGCRRRLDVACVRSVIATAHRTRPSAVKPAPTGCRRRLDVALVVLVIAADYRMHRSAVKPAPTCCRRRLDVAFVRSVIATAHRMQPSAVKPAPTCCRRRLDVACVVLVIATGHRMHRSAVKPAPTGCRRRLDVACVASAIATGHRGGSDPRASPRLNWHRSVLGGILATASRWRAPSAVCGLNRK